MTAMLERQAQDMDAPVMINFGENQARPLLSWANFAEFGNVCAYFPDILCELRARSSRTMELRIVTFQDVSFNHEKETNLNRKIAKRTSPGWLNPL